MRLDIRVPLGLLFLVLGSLLLIFGLISNKDLYDRSLGTNINLWWGIVMSLFALVLLVLAYRGHRRAGQSQTRGNASSGHE